jgi:hypothetical protein
MKPCMPELSLRRVGYLCVCTCKAPCFDINGTCTSIGPEEDETNAANGIKINNKSRTLTGLVMLGSMFRETDGIYTTVSLCPAVPRWLWLHVPRRFFCILVRPEHRTRLAVI